MAAAKEKFSKPPRQRTTADIAHRPIQFQRGEILNPNGVYNGHFQLASDRQLHLMFPGCSSNAAVSSCEACFAQHSCFRRNRHSLEEVLEHNFENMTNLIQSVENNCLATNSAPSSFDMSSSTREIITYCQNFNRMRSAGKISDIHNKILGVLTKQIKLLRKPCFSAYLKCFMILRMK